ncbi:hypothetical protein HF086_000227 [Spodoptera exigua]|uniref:UDP-glycosyltransferase n=1 Tax=Spodoptera exigua TaxID=7107 RepID=A0A922MD67_SPOEX|nr:hypothetical protein HF086_000227 [Spodoptera exigua]
MKIYHINIILCLSIFARHDEAARILAVFPSPSISHQVVFRPLTQELAKRGHEVTVITTDPAFPEGKAPANLTEINVHDISYNLWRKIFLTSNKENKDDVVKAMNLIAEAVIAIADAQLKDSKVQNLIRDKSKKFDLLLVEACVRPALVFSHIYKIPVIQISSFFATFDNSTSPANNPLKSYSTSRRKLLFNFVKEQADLNRKDSIQSGSESSTVDAKPKEVYKLREPSNIKYFDDENDTEDFSPDCSEYIPSPERQLPDSRSTSSCVTDLQDTDIIKISSSTTHLQENDTSSLGDITLTPVNEHGHLPIHNLAEINLQSTSDDLEKTLTPTKPTSSDCNISNSELMQKEQPTLENSDEKENYALQKYNIEITIEPESPDTDSITIDKAVEINTNSNNLSNKEQNERINAESSLINDCDIDTSLRSLSRKRKRNASEWRDNKNKKLKNSGQAYEGARNKKHHEKKNISSDNCACKKGCGLKFNTEDRLALHTNFYKLANRELQWQYITRHVKSNDVKRVTNYPDMVKMASKRQYERVFNTNYNYSFFKPKKDQCTLCSQYQQADSVEKASLEENYRKHLSMKERVREIKKEEKKTLNKDDTVVAIFDLEKVLNVPQSEVIIMNAKVSGEKYILKEMQQSEILNIKVLVEPKRWLQDKTGEKVRWSDVMEISVSYNKPNCFLFKYDFDQDYIELDYNASASRQRRQKQVSKTIESIELKPAYDKPLPIRKALYNDLLSLCNSQAIPHHYQPFYRNLSFCDAESGHDEDSD